MQTRKQITNNQSRMLSASAMCLAMCLVLPFLTGQIPQIGSALCPMHLPVLLAGFLCGPWWALTVGITAPLLRHLLFAMPPLPTAIAMSFELAAYGAVCGGLYRRLPHNLAGIYGALTTAMLMGRVLWGAVMMVITGISGGSFTWGMFLAGAFTSALPGILLQLILIPVIVSAMRKANFIS